MSTAVSTPVRTVGFLRPWLLWTVGFVSFPISGIVGGLVAGRVDSPLAALIGGVATGAVIGLGQALASSRRLPLVRWILATAVGMGLGLLARSDRRRLRHRAHRPRSDGRDHRAVPRRRAGDWRCPGRRASRLVWAAAMPLLWALGWTVTTLVGIAVDQQFTVFGAAGAVTFSALSGVSAAPPPPCSRQRKGPVMNTSARHVIFGTGAIGLATLDALRRRGETVRMVNRSGSARGTRRRRGGRRERRRPGLLHRGEPAAPPWSTRRSTRRTPGGPRSSPALQAGVLAGAEAARSPAGQHGERLHVRPPGRPPAHRDPRVRGAHQEGPAARRDGPRPARRPPGRTRRGGHRSRVGLLRTARRRPVQPG